jgi:hypothetical protein
VKRLIPILLAIGLAGCATLTTDFTKLQQVFTLATTATVPASVAQVAVSSFQVLEAGATEYFKYCKTTPADTRCNPGTLQAPGPLRLAIKYDRQGRTARDQIKAAGRTGALISSTTYNLLATAITNLTATPASTFGATK